MASRNAKSGKTRGEQSQLIDMAFRRNQSGFGSFATRRSPADFPYRIMFIELDSVPTVANELSIQNYCDRPEEMFPWIG
ncbi:hypothetical protein AB0C38_43920 [Amycolatopsis sp. NPDC048633]|uniref:hypothetical protein n=1 Tax=Amycolatopsis sp. NPDC048633 TaxID=3157095 RepID=UPI0033D583C4